MSKREHEHPLKHIHRLREGPATFPGPSQGPSGPEQPGMLATAESMRHHAFEARGSRTATDMLLKCGACGRTLMRVPAGSLTWEGIKGPCDCSWGCCGTSRAAVHDHHMVYVIDDGTFEGMTLSEERDKKHRT